MATNMLTKMLVSTIRRRGTVDTVAKWALALFTTALPCAARAQTTAPVTVTVDATGARSPLERVWAFHGYDEINYTTSPEGEDLLATLAAAHTAPVHVRSHFLFNTGDGTPALKWGSTNVYTEDDQGNPVYSWPLTDGIMHAFASAGVLPLVELGFMPEALSTHAAPYRNSSTTSLDGGCFYPPTDYAKWGALIGAWATHASASYPDVGSWLWELWNEPDIGYWNGTVADYGKLYDYTEAALHAVLPDAPLGGPATASPGGTFLNQFLKHCATGTNAVTGQVGTRLDLISFHAKGGAAVTGDGHVQMDLGNQLRIHRLGFTAVASFPQFQRTPIYITEADPDGCAACPATDVPADAYRNSTAYGAYELAMMKQTLDLEAQVGVALGGVLTWAFTFPGTPYFAGYRALSTNGIHLPVLGAFQLLGRLEGDRVPLDSSAARPSDDIIATGVRDQPLIDGMATWNDGAVQVLLWNYHDDLVDTAPAAVHLTVRLPPSFAPAARVSHLRVDESHGDAYAVWVSQGMPSTPSAAQLTALRQAMDPAALGPEQTQAVGTDGALAVDFALPRFGISLLTVQPGSLSDGGTSSTDGGAGGGGGGGCSCRLDPRGNPADEATLVQMIVAAVALSVARRRGVARRGARRRLTSCSRRPGRS